MSRAVEITMVLLLFGASVTAAQTTATVQSDGSDVVVTIWAPESTPRATVLLVPGWAGGPTDVLGLGQALSSSAISVVVLTPRGWHDSEGSSTFANALDDIGAALGWIRSTNRSDLEPANVIVGGHSWGGGMALAYAARDPSVERVFSIAGTDHGQFIRQYETDEQFAEMVDGLLASSAAPQGPIRFDVQYGLREMADGQSVYGLLENAPRLATRSVLLVGGWEDVNVTVDATLLPLYRAIRSDGGTDLRFETYHADHGFRSVRAELHADLVDWVLR